MINSVVQVAGDAGSTSDSGDFTFGTKVWLLKEKPRRPSFAFLYEVKLPNGSNEGGAATDETDFFGYLITSKGMGKKDILHGNLGLGILGNPFANSSQNDIFILRLAWERKLSANRLLGVEGLMQGGPKEGDDPTFLHAVYAQKLDNWVLWGGVNVGVSEDADDFAIDFGVRRAFSLWSPRPPERRNPW